MNYDYSTDILAIWAEMEQMVAKGKTKTIGVSNFTEKQIERILKVCKIRPAIQQVEVHAYFSNRNLVEYCKAQSIPVCAYAPLGSPARGFGAKDNPLQDPVVIRMSRKYEKRPGQILLRHLIQRGLIYIPKSGNSAHIKENFNKMMMRLDFYLVLQLK